MSFTDPICDDAATCRIDASTAVNVDMYVITWANYNTNTRIMLARSWPSRRISDMIWGKKEPFHMDVNRWVTSRMAWGTALSALLNSYKLRFHVSFFSMRFISTGKTYKRNSESTRNSKIARYTWETSLSLAPDSIGDLKLGWEVLNGPPSTLWHTSARLVRRWDQGELQWNSSLKLDIDYCAWPSLGCRDWVSPTRASELL